MILKEAKVIYESKRVPGERPCAQSSKEVYELMLERALEQTRETFWVLYLDGKCRVTSIETVAVGHVNGVEVHPREVFRGAIIAGATSIIVAHNHPSGDPEPSYEDRALTRRLVEAGAIVGIKVMDHIVIGDEGYRSFATDGAL